MSSLNFNINTLKIRFGEYLLLILLALILTSCAPYTTDEQSAHTDFLTLSQANQVGQTFVAGYDGLQGISIFIKPGQEPNAKVNLILYEGRNSSAEIRSTSIRSAEISKPGFYNFNFEPIDNSTGKDFFFELTYQGSDKIRVGSAPGNSYLEGAQYLDGSANNSQTSFHSSYAVSPMLIGLFSEGLKWIWYLALTIFLFVIPGWAALSWLLPGWKQIIPVTKIILSLGIGVSFYPLGLLWMNTMGIHSNYVAALTLPILGLIFILIKQMRDRKNETKFLKNSEIDQKNSDGSTVQRTSFNWHEYIPDLAVVLILLVIIFTRFWPVRNLDAPMWGDSYQHTMIAQLLIDNEGLFNSWQPYAQLSSFTYHFGFHSLVQNFAWYSGLGIVQSTLWMGQLLNIIAILAIYPLAVMIGKNKWSGVIALLIAGLISSMPMYYLNWGRYTQLTSLIILPVIIFVIWKNLESDTINYKWDILVWVGLSGLALTHYRIVLFIPLFYISYFVFHLKKQEIITTTKKALSHAIGMVLLLLPWLFRLSEGTLPKLFGTQITTAAADISQTTQSLNEIGSITNYLPLSIWILLALSVIWGIFTRSRLSMIFSLWWFLIFLVANPTVLNLPGTGIITNFAVFISAYMPAGILIGSSFASFLRILKILPDNDVNLLHESVMESGNQKKTISSVILIICVALICVWFIRPRIRDIRPAEHALLTRPDIRSMEWIQENLTSEAKFLVNSFFAYGGTLVAGSDGGWWLPLLTRRDSTQPPLLYGAETANQPDFIQSTNQLITLITEKGIDHPDVLTELKNRNITHIYIGQLQGQVNTTTPLLNLQTLIESSNYSPVFHQDRVWIFSIQ
jgi:hypothetical protein